MTTAFVRIERDNDYNKRLRAEGDTRGIIYDYDVMIDGERRAVLSKKVSVGYELYDPDGRPVVEDGRTWRSHLGAFVKRKSDFETTISTFLEAGKIPTLQQREALRGAEETAALAKRGQILDNTRENIINGNGIKLYNALAAVRGDAAAARLLAEIDREVAAAQAHAAAQIAERAA